MTEEKVIILPNDQAKVIEEPKAERSHFSLSAATQAALGEWNERAQPIAEKLDDEEFAVALALAEGAANYFNLLAQTVGNLDKIAYDVSAVAFAS